MRRTDIEAGVTEFAEKLEAVSTTRSSLKYLLWTHVNWGGFQWPQFPEPPPRRITEHETQDASPVEGNEPPPIRRLDGEITRLEDIAFAGGTYCEVWVGRWVKGGGEDEKVSLSLTTSVLLKKFFLGSLESTSHTQITREGA